MGSLVLDKINYALEKKAEICELLGLTGNPTWNQIKTKISENAIALQKIGNSLCCDWAYLGSGVNNIENGEYVYKFLDGYYFYGDISSSKFLNQETNTWSNKSWKIDGIISSTKLDGTRFWNDGVNDYYSNGTKQYKYEDGELKSIQWQFGSGVDISNITGNDIWKDSDNNIYFSGGNIHYKLNNGIWEAVTCDLIFTGRCAWHANGKTFISPNTTTHYYFKSLSEYYRVYIYTPEDGAVSFHAEEVFETNVETFRNDNRETIQKNISYLSIGDNKNYYIDGYMESYTEPTYTYKMKLKNKKWTGKGFPSSSFAKLNSRGFWTYKGVLYCAYYLNDNNFHGQQRRSFGDYVEWIIPATEFEVDN